MAKLKTPPRPEELDQFVDSSTEVTTKIELVPDPVTKEKKETRPFLVHVDQDNSVVASTKLEDIPESSRILMSCEATGPRQAINIAAKFDAKIDPKTKTYALS